MFCWIEGDAKWVIQTMANFSILIAFPSVVDTAKGKDSTCTRICQEDVASRSRADDKNSFPKRVSL
jgi:hypothetical protein